MCQSKVPNAILEQTPGKEGEGSWLNPGNVFTYTRARARATCQRSDRMRIVMRMGSVSVKVVSGRFQRSVGR